MTTANVAHALVTNVAQQLGRTVTRLSQSLPVDPPGVIAAAAAGAGLVFIAVLAWLRFCATLRIRAESDRFAYRIPAVAGAVVGGWIFALVFVIIAYLSRTGPNLVTADGQVLFTVAREPLTVAALTTIRGPVGGLSGLALVVLAATPVVTACGRRQTATTGDVVAVSTSNGEVATAPTATAPPPGVPTSAVQPSSGPRLPVWAALAFALACPAAVLLARPGRYDTPALAGTTLVLAALATLSTRVRATSYVAVAATLGCTGWFIALTVTAGAGWHPLSRALFGAAAGLAVNLTNNTQVDWRLAGLAGLLLGWIGWLAVAIGLCCTLGTDGALGALKSQPNARRRWSGLILATATAAVAAVSVLSFWQSLQSVLPVAWRD